MLGRIVGMDLLRRLRGRLMIHNRVAVLTTEAS
jgi:hypothetical protein